MLGATRDLVGDGGHIAPRDRPQPPEAHVLVGITISVNLWQPKGRHLRMVRYQNGENITGTTAFLTATVNGEANPHGRITELWKLRAAESSGWKETRSISRDTQQRRDKDASTYLAMFVAACPHLAALSPKQFQGPDLLYTPIRTRRHWPRGYCSNLVRVCRTLCPLSPSTFTRPSAFVSLPPSNLWPGPTQLRRNPPAVMPLGASSPVKAKEPQRQTTRHLGRMHREGRRPHLRRKLVRKDRQSSRAMI